MEPKKFWLSEFEGQHVTVMTKLGTDERMDTGTLLKIGDGWLQLAKDNGDVVLIPSTAIRLVKMLDLTHSLPALERDTLPPLNTHIYEPNAQTI